MSTTYSSFAGGDIAAVRPPAFFDSNDLIARAIEREITQIPEECFMLHLRQHPLLKACAEDVERACARFEIDPTQPALVRGFLLGMVYQRILHGSRQNNGPRSM